MKRDCCELILNHACDLRCSFCSQADFDTAASMPAAEAARHILAARRAGFTRLGFSGGEATLRRDLPALVRAARTAGFKAVRLQTNGTRLADPAAAARLARAGLTVCKFTFAGDTAALHDGLAGRRGAFAKSLAGLANMLRLKLSVGVNLLVTEKNYRRLPEMLRFFMDRGVASFVLIYPNYCGAMARPGAPKVSLPRAAPYIAAALRGAERAGLGSEVKALNVPPCLLPGFEARAAGLYRFNTVVVSASGESRDLDLCVAADKTQGPPCARCFYRRRCRGLDRGYLRLFGWRGVRPVAGRPAPRRAEAGPLLTNNERCFLELLRAGRWLSTARVLKAARGVPLCYDCSDGHSVTAAGALLLKKGLIERSFRGGSYYWRLRRA